MTKKITAEQFASEIIKYDNIMILTHSHPDGDTIGTGEALLNILSMLGNNAVLVCTDELPEHIRFISEYADPEKCYFGRKIPENLSDSAVVSVDIATGSLVDSSFSQYTEKICLALDHHDINTLDCPLLFIDENASSAGEAMYDVIKFLEDKTGKKLIDKNTACALYTAISSDSGNFKYSCTTGKTLKIAGELIDLGAENAEIARMLFDVKSLGTFKAEALCTENITFLCEGKLAFSYMTKEMCKERGILENEFDTCVQLLRMIKGVEIGVFAKEKYDADGKKNFRLSMRSNTYADVASICAHFGGGGHKKAAGCTVYGEIADVIKNISDITLTLL